MGWLLASKKRSTLPNGTLPFYVTFCALSASWSCIAAVSWWRRGAAVVRQQYFNSSADSWMVCHLGGAIWADPKTVVTSIWRERVTQVLISLHLNLWSTPSVYRSRRPLWITTCQDVACLSASRSAHSSARAHKHRRTCKLKHTLSACLVE